MRNGSLYAPEQCTFGLALPRLRWFLGHHARADEEAPQGQGDGSQSATSEIGEAEGSKRAKRRDPSRFSCGW
jgi:hypothetical protein